MSITAPASGREKVTASKQLASIDAEIATVQHDPSTRDWLRQALMASQRLDPIDASHDAQQLADLLTRRADTLLEIALRTQTAQSES